MSRRVMRIGAAGLPCMLVLWITAASAQQNVDRLPSLGGPADDREPATDTTSARAAPRDDAPAPAAVLPATACAAIDDEATRGACWRAYRAELAYREQSFAQRARAFGWQYVSTIGIFFVVLFLVLAGLFFAWLQFRADVRRDGAANAPASSVELSAGGLKLTSPVLGTIILALSLGFFYLYLVHVYPIHELN